MRVPKVISRRPLDDNQPEGHQESDKDYVLNNFDACLWFLANRDKINKKFNPPKPKRKTPWGGPWAIRDPHCF